MADDASSSAGSPEYAKNPEKYHAKCMTVLQDALDNNPFMRIIMDSMKQHGCDITPSFFKCRPCPIKSGGFYDEKLGIILCENQITFKSTLEDTLMHELVHAYDVCRTELDSDDCLHVACSEIRAANLSGECNFSREIARGQFRVQKQYPNCVKRRAEAAVRMQKKCAARAPEYVEAAWRSCYRDTAPFGFVPL